MQKKNKKAIISQKRILLMAAHFHPYKGGLENFALDLGSKLAEKSHIVNVFTYKIKNLEKQDMPESEKYRGLNIYRFPSTSILGKTYTLPKFNKKYREMLQILMTNKYDAIITNTRFFTTSWLGMIYSKKIKKENPEAKFIHIEHGNVHVIHKNPAVTFVAWLYDQTVGRAIFSSADIVIGISKPCAEFAKKFGAKKTAVIHNSINTKYFSDNFGKTEKDKNEENKIIEKRKEKIRKKLGIKKSEYVIINGIGRLIYAKGLQDTITAVKGIKDVVVINIGDGPFKDNLKNLSKKLGVKSVFTGTIDKKEIINYLSIADLFVNPSYSEGLPTCVLEAGAAGIPTIATNVGGTKEIITNGRQGILIGPKNIDALKEKIDFLKNNKKTALEMGENLRRRIIEEFDWNKNIEKFEEIL